MELVLGENGMEEDMKARQGEERDRRSQRKKHREEKDNAEESSRSRFRVCEGKGEEGKSGTCLRLLRREFVRRQIVLECQPHLCRSAT
jgi:hypothetical protein